MTSYVVDTNVLVVANRRATHADLKCQLACVEMLEEIRSERNVVVDTGRLIVTEYLKQMQPGPADAGRAFLKHVFDHMYDEKRVRRVPITQSDDDRLGFEELPENQMDPSDRKFLATAVVGGAAIVNATDSDWNEQVGLMQGLGVRVQQLCPQHSSRSVI